MVLVRRVMPQDVVSRFINAVGGEHGAFMAEVL